MYNYTDIREEILEAMMELRAEFAINHAIKGFGMDIEKALELIRNKNNGLSRLEREQRDILVAAIDNLVDFAVAQEFQMSQHLPIDFDYDDQSNIDECEEIFWRYNHTYAIIENEDIEYAMKIAAAWAIHTNSTVFTYMTQGDERVRPWHLALEGISHPKSSFPAWLIPPIEHGCRCYLVEESGDVLNKVSDIAQVVCQNDDIPDFVNPVFKESVAKGGRIFSEAHSYFTIPKKHKKKLRQISKTIKSKWLERQ